MAEKTAFIKITVALHAIAALLNLGLSIITFILINSINETPFLTYGSSFWGVDADDVIIAESMKTFAFMAIGTSTLFVSAYLLAGYFLWKLNNKARYAALALAIFGLGFGILDLFSGSIYGIVVLLWNGFVVYTLFIDQKTKPLFPSKNTN